MLLSSSDFLSNLLVLLLRVKNAGLDEQGLGAYIAIASNRPIDVMLVMHLSEATAGSVSGQLFVCLVSLTRPS